MQIRKSFTLLFDHQARTTYFPSQHHKQEAEKLLGNHPWDFAHPSCAKKVQQSFNRCIEFHKPDFHIVQLIDDHPDMAYPGQCCCVWLTPVKAPQACPKACVSVMAKCVMVPNLFPLLSEQQLEILAMIADGVIPNDVATSLDVTRSAIDTQLMRIRKKLELENLLQVAVWASTYHDILDAEISYKISESCTKKTDLDSKEKYS